MKKLSLSILFAMLLLPLAAQQRATGTYVPKIIAGVVKSDSWTMNDNQEGIYELDLSGDGSLKKLTPERDVFQAPLGGAVYEDGKMRGIHFRQMEDPYSETGFTYYIYNVEYDMTDWTRTLGRWLSSTYGNLISSCGLAHDPVTGKNYGIFYNFNMNFQVLGRRLATIDFVNTESSGAPKKTIIDDVLTPFAAIAFSNEGSLYGVGQDGFLYYIDKASAELLPLGDLGIENITTYPSSMTCDPKTGKMYWSVVLQEGSQLKSYLYEVETKIGAVRATRVMQVPDNAYLVNLYIAPPQADDAAPAAPENLTATFEGESLTGTISFTAPTTTYEGEALTGDLTYTVLANNATVATGACLPGQEVEATVTVVPGDVEFAVYVSNSVDDGPQATLKCYVGPATPQQPTGVTFNYDYATQTSTVSWQAPAEGLGGETLNPANLTYNVYRMPGATLVAEAVDAERFSESFWPEELGAWSYRVEAVNQGLLKSEPAESNSAVVGPPLEVPYTNGFQNAASFNLLTILDHNNDGKTWAFYKGYSSNCAEFAGSNVNDGDDWLLTPPIRLEQGATYKLSFEAHTGLGTTYDVMSVAFGQGLDTDLYTTLFDQIGLVGPVCEQPYVKDDIKPAETGVYYFGFHAQTPASKGWLMLKSLSVTKVEDVATGIDQVSTSGGERAAQAHGQEVYDLQGRRVAESKFTLLKPGVYVCNGRKFVVK